MLKSTNIPIGKQQSWAVLACVIQEEKSLYGWVTKNEAHITVK